MFRLTIKRSKRLESQMNKKKTYSNTYKQALCYKLVSTFFKYYDFCKLKKY
jgi:hypothetical protein